MEDTLGKEYEEWLDSLPPSYPTPEELMFRSDMSDIQQIYRRLASLESEQEELRIAGRDDERLEYIKVEMQELRILLQDIMNGVCPVVKEASKR